VATLEQSITGESVSSLRKGGILSVRGLTLSPMLSLAIPEK